MNAGEQTTEGGITTEGKRIKKGFVTGSKACAGQKGKIEGRKERTKWRAASPQSHGRKLWTESNNAYGGEERWWTCVSAAMNEAA